LHRPTEDHSQFLRGMRGEIRVAEHLSREQHDIGLALTDDLVGL
jgi:hypothetical protein